MIILSLGFIIFIGICIVGGLVIIYLVLEEIKETLIDIWKLLKDRE